jgi:hypothetical protein
MVAAPQSELDRSMRRNEPDPRTATVTFATAEPFALQRPRAATIAASTGRATMLSPRSSEASSLCV